MRKSSPTSTVPPRTTRELTSPRGQSGTSASADLEAWLTHHWADGVQVETLEDLCPIVVCTQNTVYEMAILSGAHGDVIVRGGRYFPEWTAIRLAGSTLGGSLLKQLGIYVGWRIEFQLEQRRIVTSPVHSVAVVRLKTLLNA